MTSRSMSDLDRSNNMSATTLALTAGLGFFETTVESKNSSSLTSSDSSSSSTLESM